MAQKIIKIGTSIAVTIPKRLVEKLNIKVGDLAEVVEKDNELVIERLDSSFSPDIQDSLDWFDKFSKKYKKALDALSKK